jgi:hypothetical protein
MPNSGHRSSPLSQYGGVHGTRIAQKTWRNKPLFRREGDARFRTGAEAAEMLINEVKRRDSHETEFTQAFENALTVLAPVFERVGACLGWLVGLLVSWLVSCKAVGALCARTQPASAFTPHALPLKSQQSKHNDRSPSTRSWPRSCWSRSASSSSGCRGWTTAAATA